MGGWLSKGRSPSRGAGSKGPSWPLSRGRGRGNPEAHGRPRKGGEGASPEKKKSFLVRGSWKAASMTSGRAGQVLWIRRGPSRGPAPVPDIRQYCLNRKGSSA